MPIAAFCLAANFVFLIAGGFIYSGGFLGIDGYGYGWDKTRTGLLVLVIAFLLYVYRHVVQDKIPLTLREEVPLTPEEQARIRSWQQHRRRPRPSERRSSNRRGPAGAPSWFSTVIACACSPWPTSARRWTRR